MSDGAPFAAQLSRRQAVAQALTVLAVLFGWSTLSALLRPEGADGLSNPLRSVLLTGSVMLLPVALFSWRRPQVPRALGIGRQPWQQVLGFGALGFLGAYATNAVATGLYAALRGGLQAELASKAGWMVKLSALPVAVIVPLAVFVGLWEELVFRGFLLGRLRAALPPGKWRDAGAVALVAVLFSLGHGYQGALGLLQTAVVGAVLGALTVWRGSVWPAVVAHVAIDGFGLFAIRVLKPVLEEAAKGTLALP